MAKFLTTIELSFHILQIIKSAGKEIILITPFLKLSNNLKDAIADANRNEKEITLIYGKVELTNDEQFFLNKLDNLSIYYHENLHAKCYFNETEMLITSMNLYEFSEKQNKEFGIFIENANDNAIYQDVIEEVHSIMMSSTSRKKSESCKKGFKSFIIKPPIKQEFCTFLNQSFRNKNFYVEKYDDGFSNRHIFVISKNFISNVDICIDDGIDFIFNLNITTCENLFRYSGILKQPEIIKDYQIYWNKPYERIKLYKSIQIRNKWEIFDKMVKFNYYKRAIELVTTQIKNDLSKIAHDI